MTRAWRVALHCAAVCALALQPVPAAARQGAAGRRIIGGRVEHLAGGTLYLTIADSSAIEAGDTVVVLRGREVAASGRFRVIGATGRRLSVAFVGAAIGLTRGDSLWLEAPAVRSLAGPADTAAIASPTPGGRVARPPPQRAAASRGARASGNVSLDVDALSSHTAVSGSSAADRTFVTPAMRLNARVTDLPGGVRAEVHARYSHSTARGAAVATPASLRVYRATLESDFGGAPLSLRAGRFVDVNDPYAGYWDGVSLRGGGRSFGVGLAAGFEPELANQGFSADHRKIAGFVEHSVRRRSLVLRGAIVATHSVAGDSAGWSATAWERMLAGPLRLDARVRLQRQSEAAWTVEHVDVDVALNVAGPLTLRARVAERGYVIRPGEDSVPRRGQLGGGFQLAGTRGSFVADFSRIDLSTGRISNSLFSSLILHHLPGDLDVGGSATVAQTDDMRSMYIAPFVARAFGRLRLSLAGHTYRAGIGDRLYGAELSVHVPVAQRGYTALRLQTQRGDGLSSTRVFASFGLGF